MKKMLKIAGNQTVDGPHWLPVLFSFTMEVNAGQQLL